MSKKQSVKPLSMAIGAALATSMAVASVAKADVSPFSMTALSSAHMIDAGEGKCGEGKCGGGKEAEGSCGGDKGAEGSCGGDKGHEGKCGGDKGAEGSCGGDKDAEDAPSGAARFRATTQPKSPCHSDEWRTSKPAVVKASLNSDRPNRPSRGCVNSCRHGDRFRSRPKTSSVRAIQSA